MQLINGWTKESVIKHLQQNFKGKSEDAEASDGYTCRYRLADLKCVAGCFIPDTKYETQMEGKCISSLIQTYQMDSIMPFSHQEMAMWQNTHDNLNAENSLEVQLKELIDDID